MNIHEALDTISYNVIDAIAYRKGLPDIQFCFKKHPCNCVYLMYKPYGSEEWAYEAILSRECFWADDWVVQTSEGIQERYNPAYKDMIAFPGKDCTVCANKS